MSRPKKRVQLMPAIREESNLKTNRVPVRIIPPGSSPAGPLNNSMIIQNLPGEIPKPPPKVTPTNRYHDNVEQVVADYLHFSRYGKVLPVSHGYAPPACPCCLERNRENMKLMADRFRAPPPEPDPDSLPAVEPGSSDPDTPIHRTEADLSLQDHAQGASPRRRVQAESRDFPASWMDYQPLPHAQTYLNAEFNRASMLRSYHQDSKQFEDANMAYVSGRVLDASSKYDLAMKKLERSLHNFSPAPMEDTYLSD